MRHPNGRRARCLQPLPQSWKETLVGSPYMSSRRPFLPQLAPPMSVATCMSRMAPRYTPRQLEPVIHRPMRMAHSVPPSLKPRCSRLRRTNRCIRTSNNESPTKVLTEEVAWRASVLLGRISLNPRYAVPVTPLGAAPLIQSVSRPSAFDTFFDRYSTASFSSTVWALK